MGYEKRVASFVLLRWCIKYIYNMYVCTDECLLVKSTSFSPIVRDSNTIIVRWYMPHPIPHRFVDAIRRLLSILYANPDNRFYRKLFLNHSLIAR